MSVNPERPRAGDAWVDETRLREAEKRIHENYPNNLLLVEEEKFSRKRERYEWRADHYLIKGGEVIVIKETQRAKKPPTSSRMLSIKFSHETTRGLKSLIDHIGI